MGAITVVYNPKSGSADLAAIKQAFAHHKLVPTYVPITAKTLRSQIKSAAKRRGAVVVAAGGDGTVNAVAGFLQGTACTMGVIPAGTLNHFAKDLHIPLEVPEAVRVIANGHTKNVDAAEVNGRTFVNNSSIGLYPRSLRVREQYDGQVGKWPAAIIGALRVLAKPRRYHVQITADGKEQTFRTPFVFVGNNTYKINQTQFLERTGLTTGKLAIYVIKARGAFGVARLFIHALFTKKRRTQDFAIFTATSCTISTHHHKKLHVACDGEVVTMPTPLRYASLPGALRVLVP